MKKGPFMADENDGDPLIRDMARSGDVSSEVAAVIFGTVYDAPIKGIMNGLSEDYGYTREQFDALLEEGTRRLVGVGLSIPHHVRVSQSKPYVEISDIVFLGLLAFAAYEEAQKRNGDAVDGD